METEHRQETIPSWFDKHPLAAAFKEQQQAETLKRRQAAAEKLEAVKAEIAEGFPEEEASLCSVLEDLKAAEKHVTALRAEAGQAGRTLRLLKADSEHRRDIIETQLYGNYDPRIDEAQSFFRDRLDDLRRPGVIDIVRMGAERNIFTMSKVVKVENNCNAINEALQYCRDAIKQLEAMKLIPEFPEAAVEDLKACVPSIDRYQEFTGEKPFPKDPPLDAGCPSDYEIESLLQKADKMIRRRR